MNPLGKIRSLREKRWFRWTSDVVIVLVVYLGFRAFQLRGTAQGDAPSLQGTDLDGQLVVLAEAPSSPVVVHFWATWCGVCAAESHNIEAVAEDHEVITVASQSGPLQELTEYVRDHDLLTTVVPDPDGRMAARWGVRAFPTTFVVGTDGEIEHVESGYTTELGLRARLWLSDLSN